MNRRTLIALSSLIPFAACAPGASSPTPADILTEATNAVKALDSVMQQFHTAYPNLLPDQTFAAIESNVQLALQVVGQLSASLPAPDAAPLVQKIVGYLNAVLSTLAAPPLNGVIPAPLNQVIAAVAFVAPLLEAFVMQYLPNTPAVAAASPALYKLRTPMIATRDDADKMLAAWAR